MEQVITVDEVRAIRWAEAGAEWGLVPTMGALHEGHLSLVRAARIANDQMGVSIFVNPKQFNNPEDLVKYPRNVEADLALLREEGVDLVWLPRVEDVYPPGFQTTVSLEHVTRSLEGASRPGHFDGVATVVSKLFNVFQPTRAYFGQKDAQQVAGIQQMVRDLNFNLEIVVVPIVREEDGLAMSSRNVRLTPEQRAAAPILYRSLDIGRMAWEVGERSPETLRLRMREPFYDQPQARVDYVSVADPVTLVELEEPAERALLSMAVYFGEVRLIDNMVVE